MKVIDCLQNSPEWLIARAGCVTSSRIADVLAKLKRKDDEAAARRNLRLDLVAERLSNRTVDSFVSADMIWGIEQEVFARATYEISRDVQVDQVGFVLHPSLERCGASPDGLIGNDGLVEFKCPRSTTHIGYILADVVPTEYQPQMLWQMECCERQWCDFVSYDGRMPERFQLFVKRFNRDEARLAEIRKEVVLFESEVQEMLAQLEAGGKYLEQRLRQSLEAVGQ